MKNEARILILDDDADLRDSLALYLKIHFNKVQTLGDPHQLNRLLGESDFDLILLDMNFQKGRNDGKEGLYWLKHVKEVRPESTVLLITAYADIDLAIESLKSGAADFIMKPWENQKLLASILRALELKTTRKKLQQFQEQQNQDGRELIQSLEANSLETASLNLLAQARKVAETDAKILITGENGTGKTLLARYIHLNSPRRNAPFVSVDLGAIPEALFEAELFGVKKGAYTDAKEDRSGMVQRAEGGTLFLDEIGNCSPIHQQKLLRLIQDQSFQITGSGELQHSNVRILAASNADLTKMVAEGSFRQDLLYRVNTVELRCLPLRERIADLKALTDHFLDQFNRRYQRKLKLNSSQYQEIRQYSWPGNIRELAHNLERAVILSENDRFEGQVCPEARNTNPDTSDLALELSLEELEARHIERVLKLHQGNISKTASHLGINRNTLYRKMEKYLDRDES